MRFLLKSIWAATGQVWDKELSAEHSKLFSDWCSELREIRTTSKNRLYFENGCTNLRLHIFTDASEEAMCIVAYLQDQATLKLTYVIGKCRVAPIRHMTVPKLELQAAVYGVRLRKQIRNEHDVKIEKKSIIGPTHQQCYSGYRQRTRNNKYSLRTEQRKYWKTHRWINGDTSKVSKTLPTSEPEECLSKASRSPYG